MSKLRNSARGQECQIRVPGVCTGDTETTVLCHYRLSGTNGIGMKPNDEQAAYGCIACHDEVDGRTHISGFIKTELRLMHAEGVFRTQELIRKR